MLAVFITAHSTNPLSTLLHSQHVRQAPTNRRTYPPPIVSSGW